MKRRSTWLIGISFGLLAAGLLVGFQPAAPARGLDDTLGGGSLDNCEVVIIPRNMVLEDLLKVVYEPISNGVEIELIPDNDGLAQIGGPMGDRWGWEVGQPESLTRRTHLTLTYDRGTRGQMLANGNVFDGTDNHTVTDRVLLARDDDFDPFGTIRPPEVRQFPNGVRVFIDFFGVRTALTLLEP